MENFLCTIIYITIISGLFGGAINYLIFENNHKLISIFRSIFTGIGAAFVVPLFLQTIASDLIGQCKEDPQYFLVYAGFCLIASIFSRRFLDTVAKRALEQAQEADRNAQLALDKVSDQEERIEDLLINNTEQDEELELNQIEISGDMNSKYSNLGDEIVSILKAFKNSKYTYRTAKGISSEIKSELNSVESLLNELERRDIVKRGLSNNAGKLYWTLTEKGSKLKLSITT